MTKRKKTTKKTHEQHNLSYAEWGAFLGTMEMLRSGTLEYVGPEDLDDYLEDPENSKHVFCMSVPCRISTKCGSVACIGGTMGQIMFNNDREKAAAYVTEHEWGEDDCFDFANEVAEYRKASGLSQLFYPHPKYDYDSITPRQALKAMENFRDTGRPHWERVLTRKNRERT